MTWNVYSTSSICWSRPGMWWWSCVDETLPSGSSLPSGRWGLFQVVLVFFLLPSQRPMKWYCYYYFLRGLWNCYYYYFFNQLFCRVHLNSGLFYASYDLLWEVVYFSFIPGLVSIVIVGRMVNESVCQSETIEMTESSLLNGCARTLGLSLLWRDTLLLKIWWKLWTLLLPKW